MSGKPRVAPAGAILAIVVLTKLGHAAVGDSSTSVRPTNSRVSSASFISLQLTPSVVFDAQTATAVATLDQPAGSRSARCVQSWHSLPSPRRCASTCCDHAPLTSKK